MDAILKFFASLDLINFLELIGGVLVVYLIIMWFLMGKKKRENLMSKVKGNKTSTSSSKKRTRYDELDELTLDNLQFNNNNNNNNNNTSIPAGNPVVQTPKINESYKAVVIEDEDSVTIRAGNMPPVSQQVVEPTLPTKPQATPKVEPTYNINLKEELDLGDDVNVNLSQQPKPTPNVPPVQKPAEVVMPTKAPQPKPTVATQPAPVQSAEIELNAQIQQLAQIEDEEEMNSQVLNMIESMSNEVRRLRQEVEKMREQQTDLRTEFTKLKELQASQAPHTQAIMLAKQGLAIQEIIERCGISQSEAELIMSLYHK